MKLLPWVVFILIGAVQESLCSVKKCPLPYYLVPLNEMMTAYTCIKFQLPKQDFFSHKKACEADGAYLAEPNLYVQDFLLDVLRSTGAGYWVGGHDVNEEGVWTWLSGRNFSSSEVRWKSGQPNGGTGSNHAIVWPPEYWMHDQVATDKQYALCQMDLLDQQFQHQETEKMTRDPKVHPFGNLFTNGKNIFYFDLKSQDEKAGDPLHEIQAY